MFQEGPAPW